MCLGLSSEITSYIIIFFLSILFSKLLYDSHTTVHGNENLALIFFFFTNADFYNYIIKLYNIRITVY
jgi:hypothetical protein